VAFVAPWYGANIPGGAEAETRDTAEHLHRAGFPVEVLTTCVREFRANWSHNTHRPGLSTENGVPVRRFRVNRRDESAFDAVNWKLMQGLPVSLDEEMIYIRENIRSRRLERFIADHREDYIFIFIPYMFGTTYWGIRAAGERAVLIPCLHDESYARLGIYRDMFGRVPATVFHSESEAQLAVELYDLATSKCTVLGEGVNTDWSGNEADFRRKYRIRSPFLLYAGRKDRGKNVGQLTEFFCRYRERQGPRMDLVLIGGGDLPADAVTCPGIHALGFLPEQDKYDAYAAATMVCQPSLQESFSLVLMEGWVAGTPGLVNSRCAVTTEHCRRSNGGLYYTDYREFEGIVDAMLTHPWLGHTLGVNGQRYVLQNYHWDKIVTKYRTLLKGLGLEVA
jgi:glycosyltransferase involved in cell wall biosynthesis